MRGTRKLRNFVTSDVFRRRVTPDGKYDDVTFSKQIIEYRDRTGSGTCVSLGATQRHEDLGFEIEVEPEESREVEHPIRRHWVGLPQLLQFAQSQMHAIPSNIHTITCSTMNQCSVIILFIKRTDL